MIRYFSIAACMLLTVAVLPAAAADTFKFKPLSAAYQDSKSIPLRYPEGVAFVKNKLFVADTGNGRLVSFDLNNDTLANGTEYRFEQITYPIRLKSTPGGDVLVLDGKTRKIAKIDKTGALLGMLEPRSVTAPAEYVIRSMAVDSRSFVYLADILGERVLVLDAGSAVVRQIPFPKGYGYIADVAVDSKGNILIIDSIRSQLLKVGPTDTEFSVMARDLNSYIYFAVGLEVDPQGRIYLLDQNDNGLVILGQDGSLLGRYLSEGWKPGQLYYPGQGTMSEGGVYAVADRNNSRIQIYRAQ